MPRIAILGGGIIGVASSYYLTKLIENDEKLDINDYEITIIEKEGIASCASGKAGGFLAKGWGDNITSSLHEESFKLHIDLAKELEIESFRFLPTLGCKAKVSKDPFHAKKQPPKKIEWINGNGVVSLKDMDKESAQVTPFELVSKMFSYASSKSTKLLKANVCNVKFDKTMNQVKVEYFLGHKNKDKVQEDFFEKVIVALGPWSVLCNDWFKEYGFHFDMTSIKSTSIIFQNNENKDLINKDAFALFCEEDENHCHLEVYPRPNGDVYVCGLGGSIYLDENEVKKIIDNNEILPEEGRVKAAIESFQSITTVMKDTSVEKQACLRPCPSDSVPLIGFIEQTNNSIVISAGHNCWGILWGPISGKINAELVLSNESHSIPNLNDLNPHRFK